MTSFFDERALGYLSSIPWCNALLEDPAYVVLRGFPPRTPSRGTTCHTLTRDTLNTRTTMPAVVSLYKKPLEGNFIAEATVLVALGSDVNGHADTAHGGLVATIMDECAGLIQRLSQTIGGDARCPIYTAYLNVRFKQPVKTPGVVAVDSKIVSMEGRKKKVLVQMKDQGRSVLAEAEALFVRSKEVAKM
ncbi:hypothetical protein BU16DRAFT_162443 [Lophium mytilinum]|uniref:Thioesterase domain-containing protein n=1 Tax=Lophium mytilinum TaxID=390894 RepID=A0A6A6QC49_9PEZI|nr:hypothetical protein BU16DRAFT_162443 [Lophium mytilinum]